MDEKIAIQIKAYKQGLILLNATIVASALNNIIELLHDDKYCALLEQNTVLNYGQKRIDVFAQYGSTNSLKTLPIIRRITRALGCEVLHVPNARYPQMLGESKLLILVEELLEVTFETIVDSELDYLDVVKLLNTIKLNLHMYLLFWEKRAKYIKIKNLGEFLKEYQDEQEKPAVKKLPKTVNVVFTAKENNLPF